MVERSNIEFDVSPVLNPGSVLKSVTSIPYEGSSFRIALVVYTKKDSDPEKIATLVYSNNLIKLTKAGATNLDGPFVRASVG